MESNQDLFRQAILDAKAVRETSLATARTTLAEHFEPLVKSMFQETVESMEEAEQADIKKPQHMKHIHEDDMEESSLDEILAELDGMEEGEDLEEGKVTTTAGYDEKAHTVKGETGYDEKAKTTHGDHKLHEAEDDDDTEEDDKDAEKDDKAEEAGEDLTKGIEGGEDMESSDEQEVVDITVGELKDIIRDVFMTLQGGEDAALDAGTDLAADLDTDSDADMAGEDEISLEEILAELDKEAEGKMEEAVGVPAGIQDKMPGAVKASEDTVGEVKKELNEAVKTIKALKAELNEINLFNAKLMYVNKIFKAKNLNESQKTRVINAFDRATSVKEVENTYRTLQETVSAETKKSSLKESVGFASKPIGNAPARPIVEVDAFVTRWQQLAGIK